MERCLGRYLDIFGYLKRYIWRYIWRFDKISLEIYADLNWILIGYFRRYMEIYGDIAWIYGWRSFG